MPSTQTPSPRTRLPRLVAGLLALLLPLAAPAAELPRIQVETSLGDFVIELSTDRAPLTAANFQQYVRDGHYNGTVIHRIENNFVFQGGGYDTAYKVKQARPPIPNESGNGLSNKRFTVGLARAGNPHSGNAQFYVNLADNEVLDPNPARWGYAVFGRVIDGFDVVDRIGQQLTGDVASFKGTAPLTQIVIRRMFQLPALAPVAAPPAVQGAPVPPPVPPAEGSQPKA
jgi:cyclophilin family peptidyl-prolyl cis-trans isomerase